MIEEGTPYALGSTWDGTGVNFALFSAHATKVELCLFDNSGRRETARHVLPEQTDQVWHGYLRDVEPGQVYGYRVHGPYDPNNGHRFNPAKLLLDPYAKQIVGEIRWHDALFGYRMRHSKGDLSMDRRDSAPYMPKARVIDSAHTWSMRQNQGRAWSETIIYEGHVKGLTMRHPRVPERIRGTLAGLGHPAMIDHLVKLGITAIELLPIHAFVNDKTLLDKGLSNYWGYNTLGFFAPHPSYLATRELLEMRRTVHALHAAGIEVILDVVYNHTGEGNHLGPTLSFRGIDNASYYKLLPGSPRYYDDMTGTGNTLDLTHPRVLQMVMDSLRHWVTDLHVDGFRFDLASTLAREAEGFDRGSGFLDAVRQDPVLSRVKMIAEPWDVGMGGYQVGNFPPGWSEWNDRYRDTMRSFWKGDEGRLGEFAERLAGSSDLYNHEGRRPWASINFITAHDGFTLADTVSYNDKHNEANGEDNKDGHSDNKSWNCGVEGPTDDEEILALRRRQQRNFLATLLLSQGVPMVLAGDELGRSQQGNNNAYCQDNELSWIDWNDGDLDLLLFVRRLIRLRQDHPALRRAHFFNGQPNEHGEKDITWLSPAGGEMSDEDWQPHHKSMAARIADPEGAFLMLINAHHEPIEFNLPEGDWTRLLDTAELDSAVERTYATEGRSFVLLRGRQA